MSLTEETISNYDDYKDRIKALEDLGPSKNRVVFLFRDPGNKKMDNVLEGAKGKGLKGTLIHVLISKKEFDKHDCPYKTDAKFKVTDLPYGIVFNNKLTLGRETIQKKIIGEAAFTELKVCDLFK